MKNSKAMNVKSWVSELAKYRFLLKPTLIFAAIFAVGLLALIRADFNYYDDYGRTNEGYQYWEQFGRYVSNWGATLLHTNQFLAEISPLTQLVACLIMGLASTIAVYAITGVKEFKVRLHHADPGYCLEVWEMLRDGKNNVYIGRDDFGAHLWYTLRDAPDGFCERDYIISRSVEFIICTADWTPIGRDGNDRERFAEPYPTWAEACEKAWKRIRKEYQERSRN